jgi:hypothetical protein
VKGMPSGFMLLREPRMKASFNLDPRAYIS